MYSISFSTKLFHIALRHNITAIYGFSNCALLTDSHQLEKTVANLTLTVILKRSDILTPTIMTFKKSKCAVPLYTAWWWGTCVNRPKVVTWERHGRELNPWPLSHESNHYTSRPHRYCNKVGAIIIDLLYLVMLAAITFLSAITPERSAKNIMRVCYFCWSEVTLSALNATESDVDIEALSAHQLTT